MKRLHIDTLIVINSGLSRKFSHCGFTQRRRIDNRGRRFVPERSLTLASLEEESGGSSGVSKYRNVAPLFKQGYWYLWLHQKRRGTLTSV